MSDHEGQLTTIERTAVISISIKEPKEHTNKATEALSYLERIEAKCRHLSVAATQSIGCKLILATSCTVEHLFSAARWISTGLHKRMPLIFESLLLLKLNRKHLGIKFVSSAMKLSLSE